MRTVILRCVLAILVAGGCYLVEPGSGSGEQPLPPATVSDLRTELGLYSVEVIDVPDVSAAALDSSGRVLLASSVAGSPTRIWDHGALTTLSSATGEFRGNRMNDQGDVAGLLDGVPAIWAAGAAEPRPLGGVLATGTWHVIGINNRGEMLVWAGHPGQGTVYVWRNDEIKASAACQAFDINNLGFILTYTCDGWYDHWSYTGSPFGAQAPPPSTRFAGRTCTRESRGSTGYGRAINDLNEVIDNDGKWQTRAGCAPVGNVFAMNSRGLVLGAGSQPGCSSCASVPMIFTDHGRISADSLLSPEMTAAWRIASVNAVNNAGQITATVERKSDSKAFLALLSPAR